MEVPSINYIGPYKVIEEVGAGGLGRVFKAKDPDTGDIVAVKILYDKFVIAVITYIIYCINFC